MFCQKCNKDIGKKSYNGMCQACYHYFKNGGQENELPPNGVIMKDYRGCVICHICGRAYKKLGSHAKESHNLTIAEYKERFGLCSSAKTTEDIYSEKMRCLAYKNKMDKNLKEWGKNTRMKKGDNHFRLGKKIRLQESLNKKKRGL